MMEVKNGKLVFDHEEVKRLHGLVVLAMNIAHKNGGYDGIENREHYHNDWEARHGIEKYLREV